MCVCLVCDWLLTFIVFICLSGLAVFVFFFCVNVSMFCFMCVCVSCVRCCVFLYGLFVFVMCVVFVCACLIVCFVWNRLCDVAWCLVCCLFCVCVLRFYHVKYVFVCFGGLIV